MHKFAADGDAHADLWHGLTPLRRIIDSFKDVAVGEHEAYGLAVVTTDGVRSIWEWHTQRPVRIMSDDFD